MTGGVAPPDRSGPYEIRARAGETEAWDAYARARPDATFFHRSAWQEAVARVFGYRDLSFGVWRDGRLRGIMPLSLVPTLPFGHALVSAPQAVYGGPVADDDEALAALATHARAVGERHGVRYIEYRNRRPMDGLPVKDLYVTFRKEILPGADANMASIPRNQRRSIRIGQKSGLEPVYGGTALLDEFYRVYATSVRNLGTPVFPKRLFATLLEAFPGECDLLTVRHAGEPVAAVLTFYDRGEVLPYYGGSLRSGWKYGVNDFMYWCLLLRGVERGDRVFDFGRSKRGSGSYDFKRHWGFEPTPLAYQYDLVRQRSLPDWSPRNPKFSFAIELWKRLPLAVATRLGPPLVRYFP